MSSASCHETPRSIEATKCYKQQSSEAQLLVAVADHCGQVRAMEVGREQRVQGGCS